MDELIRGNPIFLCPVSEEILHSTTIIRSLEVRPIPILVAKRLIEQKHYLHSLPGGTKLSFGAFLNTRLMGALTLGVGPSNGFCLVAGATPEDCLTLTRLWLADELPSNSESRVIGIVLKSLRQHTKLKVLLSYADPALGHLGTIYQATGWLYTGLSSATPLYCLPDGKPHHSRSLAQVLGSHSLRYLVHQGLQVKLIPQAAKHRYLYFLDPRWRGRLIVPVLPYPKREER